MVRLRPGQSLDTATVALRAVQPQIRDGSLPRAFTTPVAAGAVLRWWAAQFVSATLLYEIEARDLASFAGSAAVLVAVGALAGWLPARRAARIDPAQGLKEG
jgi:hypothetical protein